MHDWHHDTMQLAWVGSSAFVIALALVPFLRKPAIQIGLVDHPAGRKRHEGSIPLTGGLAMFLAFVVSLLLGIGLWTDNALLGLLLGMATLLAVGILDDLLDLRALLKLAVQVAVSLGIVLGTGLEITHLGQVFGPAYGMVGLGFFSIPFTVLCMVFMINAINMLDGMDGLAGGAGVIILAMLGLLGWLAGVETTLVGVALALGMATGGFLCWNMRGLLRQRAAAFMGDAGSMMLGFAIAWLAIAIASSPGTQQTITPITVAWILLLPSMDILAVSIRRLRQGRSPMSPDRSHLHHILQRLGVCPRVAVGLIHLGTLTAGAIGITAWSLGWPEHWLLLAAMALMVGYTTALLNARRLLRWRHGKNQRKLQKACSH